MKRNALRLLFFCLLLMAFSCGLPEYNPLSNFLAARTYQLDETPNGTEEIFGIDEKPNGDGYFLVASTNDGCYWAETNSQIEVLDNTISGPEQLFEQSEIQPSAFTKTATGYYLTGTAFTSDPDFDENIFVLGLTNSFNLIAKKSFFRALSNDNESGFGVTESFDRNILVCGRTGGGTDEGAYLVEIASDLDRMIRSKIVIPGETAIARAVLKTNSDYWLTGVHHDLTTNSDQAFFAQVDPNLNLIPSSLFSIEANQFEAKKIIAVDQERPMIIGNLADNGFAILLRVGQSSPIWKSPTYPPSWKFLDGILTSTGRIVLVGSLLEEPAWFEIDVATGDALGNAQSYGPQVGSGYLNSVIETSDGGFLMGGKTTKDNASLLIKSDVDGRID